jgi:hypothetical protein
MSKDITMLPPGTPVAPDFDVIADLILPAPHDLPLPPHAPEEVWVEHAIAGQRAHLIGQQFRDEAAAQAHGHEHGHDEKEAHRSTRGSQPSPGTGEPEPEPALDRSARAARLAKDEKDSLALYQRLSAMWTKEEIDCGFPTRLIDRANLEASWQEKLGDKEFRWMSAGIHRRAVYLGEDTSNWLAWMALEKKAINCVGWQNNALVVAADAAEDDAAAAVDFYDPKEPRLIKQEAVIVGFRLQRGHGGHGRDEHHAQGKKGNPGLRALRKVFRQIADGEREIQSNEKPFTHEETLPELPVDYQVWLPNLRKTVWVSQKVLRRQFGRGYGLIEKAPAGGRPTRR